MRIKSLAFNPDRPLTPSISYKIKLGGKMVRGKTPQQNRAGRTLEEKFRFAVNSRDDRPLSKRQQLIQDCFESHYESLEVDRINVYLVFGSSEKNFPTTYENRQQGFCQFRCDSQTIYEEKKAVDRGGSIYQETQACDRPCASPENAQACPLGCKPIGRLYLQVQELVHEGYQSAIGVLETTGIHNAIELSKQLDLFEEVFGDINKTPYQCPTTLGKIPWILTRTPKSFERPEQERQNNKYVRTGKLSQGTVWVPTLDPHPEWVKEYQEYLQWCNDRASLGLPQQSALHLPEGVGWKRQAYLQGTSRLALPPGTDLSINRGDLYEKIKRYMQTINWSEQQIRQICHERYGKTGAANLADSELMNLILYMEKEANG